MVVKKLFGDQIYIITSYTYTWDFSPYVERNADGSDGLGFRLHTSPAPNFKILCNKTFHKNHEIYFIIIVQ